MRLQLVPEMKFNPHSGSTQDDVGPFTRSIVRHNTPTHGDIFVRLMLRIFNFVDGMVH